MLMTINDFACPMTSWPNHANIGRPAGAAGDLELQPPLRTPQFLGRPTTHGIHGTKLILGPGLWTSGLAARLTTG
jgi:hypothetical protein